MFMRKTLAAGFVALSALAVSMPAQAASLTLDIFGPRGGITIQAGEATPAQYRGGYHRWSPRRALSPQQVAFRLQRQGFHNVRFLDTSGRTWRATAMSRRHGRVVLTIDARTGQITAVNRAGRGWGRGGRGWR